MKGYELGKYIQIEVTEKNGGKIESDKTRVIYTYKSFVTDLSIGNFAKKNNGAVLTDPAQTNFLDLYIEHAGIAGHINRIYSESKSILSIDNLDFTEDLSNKTMRNKLKVLAHALLDLFNVDDVTDFLSNIGVKVPRKLGDTFNKSLETDGVLTEDQTYTKSEYLELMSVAICIKALIPILGEVFNVHSDIFLKENESLSFLSLINEHEFMNTKPVNRLRRYINAHVRKKTDNKEAALKTVAMRAKVSEESFLDLMLANSLFKKLSMAILTIEPPIKSNLAALVFNVIDNATKTQVSVANRVSIKQTSRPGDGDDTGSVIEGYMQSTTISIGELAEFNQATSNVEFMFTKMGGTNLNLLNKFRKAAEKLYSDKSYLSKGSILLASYIIHKSIIDCRSITYIDYHNAINCIVSSAAFIYERGHKEISNMMMIQHYAGEEFIPSLSSKNAPEELKNKIIDKYLQSVVKPKKGKIYESTEQPIISVIIPFVNSFDKNFLDGVFEYLLPVSMRPDSMKNDHSIMVIPSEFKAYFIKVLIEINE